MPDADQNIDTLSDLRTVDQNRRGRVVRRVTIAVITLFVLGGVTGLFGVRSRTSTASADGYTLSVTHAWVSRAGLDTPWRVTVHHAGGFDGSITLATTLDYFDIFESQGFNPEPDSETTGDRYLYQDFAAPPGDTLTVDYDAYIQPGAQRGKQARTALIIGGKEITAVDYRTRLMP